MKVVVEGRRCKGYGYCADLAPEVYELDASGFNNLVGAAARELTPEQHAPAHAGARACPMHALTILEAQGDEPKAGDGRAPVDAQS
jgi:ferredoxin